MSTPTKLTATLIAIAAALPATAAAAPQAHRGYIFASAPGKDYSSLSAPAPVVASSDGGFQWGDAGIGAAAALLVVAVGTAGAVTVRHGAA
jgi:hypothetical protein